MNEISDPDAGQGASNARTHSSPVVDILALLHSETDAHPAAAYALSLAEMFGAHLTVAGLTRDPARQMYLAQAQAPILAAAVDAARMSADAFAQKIANEAAAKNIAATALTFEIKVGQNWGDIVQFARLFDIAVLALPAGEDTARDEAMLETLLLQSGRGLIVVPPAYAGPPSFARPLVAWDGSRSAARAIADAMPILRQAGEAHIVTIEARQGATSSILDIAPHIERHGVACQRQEVPLSANVAQTLLQQARALGSDILVMGAFGHSRLREIVLGSTTRDILMLADLPVLLVS